MAGNNTYMDRALRHSDPRYARVLGKLGYATRHLVAADVPTPDKEDDLSDLRAQYQEIIGKRPFHGWDAETLKAKMAEADQS